MRPARGERATAPIEAGFAAFRAAGFDVPTTYSAVKAVNGKVEDAAGFELWALDADGRPIAGSTQPFRVRFVREE